ncbi:RAM signaling pathway protein-domain-containing protein [Mycena floridula]|nr:RAM signaling pathway protein-domain-containing protein [Mycena floridula]
MSPLDVDRSAAWNKRGPVHSTSLTHVHISEALLASQDDGATLIFMKKNLTDIGVDAAEELAMIGRKSPEDESSVARIALGSNRLTTLPQEFGLLSRLRYLNLKSNSFTVFPNVLRLMPALDTLDISHNKIKRLPSDPGELVNLRVFCFSKNKVTRLPVYMFKFTHLSVLEVERNPIEWPPKAVMDRPAKFPTPEAMKAWIRGVQRWIETESLRSPRQDDSRYGDLELNLEDSFNSWSQFPLSGSEEGITPHARSFSVDSTFSASSIAESELETPSSSYGVPERPPPLHLGILQTYSTETSPTQSVESYLPSPADSESFFDNSITMTGRENPEATQQHTRGASYALGAPRPSLVGLPGKKSMPDLRTAKLNFTRKIPDMPDRPTNPNRVKANDEFSMPSPLSLRQDSGSSVTSNPRALKFSTKETAVPLPSAPAQRSPTRAVPSMTFERNSYFRRLSTLPASTISNTLPEPLICLLDSARSILFAVCQIYQTLEHYTIHAIDERLASVLRKVLEPTSVEMMQLINSLDKVDAMSRKTVPPPPVCRGVVEGCRDTVAAFGRTMSVLSLQLKVLVASDDPRYLRSMLLILYASSAEISCAWQKMIPQIDALKPFLHGKHFPSPPPLGLGSSDAYPMSAPPVAGPFQWESTPPLSSLRTNSAGGRTRTARRHAGSFSSKDVEIGKQLPSYDEPLPSTRATTPKMRTPNRAATKAPVTIAAPTPPSPHPFAGDSSSFASHSRSGSLASLQASSTSSSPSIPHKTSFLELPSTSKVQVDKEALHAVQEAVDVAPLAWSMMEQMFGDVLERKPDIRDGLDRAKAVTRRLAEMIRGMQEGEVVGDRKSLREDAHVFVKTVVYLSNVIKTYGGAGSSALWQNMVKLTNATEEFTILLHVSSFPPASSTAPRPYSPLLSASLSQPSLLTSPEDSRLMTLSPSLSRSRSAQPTPTMRPLQTFQEGPRSALANQSFKVPAIRRLRERELRLDGMEAG